MFKKRLVSCHSLKLLVLIGLSVYPGQQAQAAHEQRVSFREFRSQNAGLERHFVRQMHRQLVQGGAQNSQRATASSVAQMNASERVRSSPEHLRGLGHRATNFGQSLHLNDRGRLVRLASGIDIDLSSQNKTIILGERLFTNGGTIEIEVGGEKKTLSAGSSVTAAEYIAVKQTLSGLNQSVVINTRGQATGGEINLSALTQRNDVMRAANLVIPSSVTAQADFTRGSDFRLIGDLNNFGTVEAIDNGRGRSGSIRAENISNNIGAVITSDGNLTLAANSNITNDGTISAAKNLTFQGKQFFNNGSVTAVKHVTINAASVKNGGTVLSQTGDISIDVPQTITDLPLIIDNANGTLSAASGAINLRSQSYAGGQDTYLNGGNLFCSELNLNSGNGTTDVNTNQLTGIVNSSGSATHVRAATDNLNLGKICLTGDPTFYNTAGSIAVNGSITVAEALTIVAAGDINFNNGADLIAANNTQGFPVNIIAGAAFSTTGGANQGTLGPIPPNNTNNGGVTITGASATGGAINFNSSVGVDTFISTRPAGGTGNGADVLLVAFGGSGGTSGRINTGNPTFDRIFTGGKVNGNNGNLTIIAPNLNNAGSFLPEINTTGGSGIGGNVTVTAAAPVANNANYNSLGNLVSGSITPSSTPAQNGQIRFVNVIAGQGTVTARGFLIQQSGNTSMSARRIDLDASTTNGAINLFGNITATSLLTANASGAIATQFGATIGRINSPISVLTSLNNTVGTAGAPLSVSGGTVYADGALGVNIDSIGGINLAGGSTNNGAFVVAAHGNTTITGDILLGVGSMDISTTTGALSAGAVKLSTGIGNISLANLGVDKRNTKLVLNGTQITALGSPGLGDVTLSIGTFGAPVAGVAPKKNVNISLQSGGQIFYGAKGITTLAPLSSLTAKNATIVFNNPLNKKNLVLSGVTLVADPD